MSSVSSSGALLGVGGSIVVTDNIFMLLFNRLRRGLGDLITMTWSLVAYGQNKKKPFIGLAHCTIKAIFYGAEGKQASISPESDQHHPWIFVTSRNKVGIALFEDHAGVIMDLTFFRICSDVTHKPSDFCKWHLLKTTY